MYQTQRRYLLTQGLPAKLQARLKPEDASVIADGYLEPARTDSGFTRVRLETRFQYKPFARLSHKVGRGWKRRVEHTPISEDDARRMLRWCPYRLLKRRYKFDGCTIDVYEPPLAGVIVIETNRPELPAFLKAVPGVLDVTDSLDGFQLAQLAHELRQQIDAEPLNLVVGSTSHLPRIVLTGGPCSGKSTVLTTLKGRYPKSLHCIPEVASIVIGQLGLKPWNGGDRNLLGCQSLMYRVQHSFEDAADLQARLDGKKALLLDRGIGDISAYLPGGMDQMESFLFTSVMTEHSRYDLVICLEMPSREIYEAQCANNPARTENYDQACVKAKLVQEAWKLHQNFQLIPDVGDWPTKEQAVLRLVREFLKSRQ
jgi:predicted ATPase